MAVSIDGLVEKMRGCGGADELVGAYFDGRSATIDNVINIIMGMDVAGDACGSHTCS